MPRPLSGQVQTVLGPITPAAMGVTLPHEHLLIDFTVMSWSRRRLATGHAPGNR